MSETADDDEDLEHHRFIRMRAEDTDDRSAGMVDPLDANQSHRGR